MCSSITYKYRCGCEHFTVFQCPRIADVNQKRRSPAYWVHGCSRGTTQLDEPCQECETDPFRTLGQLEASGSADAHPTELATPMEEQQAIGAEGGNLLLASDNDESENVDPDQMDDAEHRPVSDDMASNEPSDPERQNGRRVLGEITLNLL